MTSKSQMKRLVIQKGMWKTADISDCGQYRYMLTRDWEYGLQRIVFIGLNPSTADAETDDPTVRRLIRFARDWGYGGFDLLNLFALRSPDPAKLKKHLHPVGPKNNQYFTSSSQAVVAMWGRYGDYLNRGRFVADMIGQQLYCFGINGDGTPKHPLYLSKETRLVEYHQ